MLHWDDECTEVETLWALVNGFSLWSNSGIMDMSIFVVSAFALQKGRYQFLAQAITVGLSQVKRLSQWGAGCPLLVAQILTSLLTVFMPQICNFNFKDSILNNGR